MKTMRTLYDQTMEELDGVIEYSKCSIEYKEIDPDISKMYLGMAKAELEHARALHAVSQKKAAAKVGSENVDPQLMELWEEMEGFKLDKMGKAKAMLDLAM